MSDLRELYQEVILDHHNRPRNFGPLAEANRHAEGRNPLCGDHLTVQVDVEGGVIKGVAFEGAGCAISRASLAFYNTREDVDRLVDAIGQVRRMFG